MERCFKTAVKVQQYQPDLVIWETEFSGTADINVTKKNSRETWKLFSFHMKPSAYIS